MLQKKIFQFFSTFIVLFSICSLQAKDIKTISHLKYSVRPLLEKNDNRLEVRLKFKTQNQVNTYLFLPSDWAGHSKLYREIYDIECLTSQASLEDTAQPDIKRIVHSLNETVEIRYFVKSKKTKEKDWFYRPVIEKNHVFFFGHCFFAIPQISQSQPVRITLEWDEFPPEWTIANSFGVQVKKQKLFIPISTFQHATYLAGDFNLLQCGESDRPIFIAMRGHWSFSKDHFKELVQTIIEGQRSFWNDFGFPYYLVTVMPSRNHSTIAGTALTSAFSIFINDFPETSRYDWNSIAWLLSHEHFHTWNGLKMGSRASPTSESLTWFIEGFTEYYAIELNYRTHVFNFDEYLSYLNGMLYEYYASPVRNIKNERIKMGFWNDWYIQRLPYVRGFLLALNWNQKIKRQTNNRCSLDDVMHALLKKSERSGKSLNIHDIQEQVRNYIGNEAVYDIEHYIVNGETLSIEDNCFEDLAVVEWMENVGFNLKKTFQQGWVEGVVLESPSYKAGLRNGQRFVKYTKTQDQVAVHIAEENNQTKIIKYSYDNREEYIPHFTTIFQEENIAA